MILWQGGFRGLNEKTHSTEKHRPTGQLDNLNHVFFFGGMDIFTFFCPVGVGSMVVFRGVIEGYKNEGIRGTYIHLPQNGTSNGTVKTPERSPNPKPTLRKISSKCGLKQPKIGSISSQSFFTKINTLW
jgi:hypothetical protein